MTSCPARSFRRGRRWRGGSRPVKKMISLIECLKREREGGRGRESKRGEGNKKRGEGGERETEQKNDQSSRSISLAWETLACR